MINITDLKKTYYRGDEVVEAIRGIDLQIEKKEFIVVVGPSGGGKSTFLNLLGGIDHPTSGSIHYNDYALEKATEEELTVFRRDHIGFVFQFYNLLLSLNAVDNVMLPLMAKKMSLKQAREKAINVLQQVGLSHRLNHLPSELSGGEQQRVAIARSIVAEPELVLADEPTGDLDSVATREINQLMHQLNQELGITFVVATHNFLLAEQASRVYELRDGMINLKIL
jgi:putative ABC transport system ATP-binding protein